MIKKNRRSNVGCIIKQYVKIDKISFGCVKIVFFFRTPNAMYFYLSYF